MVGVLLAAGQARRFGAAKLLAAMPDGVPVGVRAASNLLSVLPRTLAVVRSEGDPLSRQLAKIGCRIVVNPSADSGKGSSIAAGVAAERDADGWLIALADMPWIRSTSIEAVVVALRAGAPLAAPSYRGRRGHPVGFAKCWRDALLTLQGDRGARDLVESSDAGLQLVPVTDAGVVQDIDVPSDLADHSAGAGASKAK